MPTEHTKIFEKIVINEYLKTRNDINTNNITYPEPPDCVAELKNGQFIWIEVRSIYRHNQLAKSLNTQATKKIFIEEFRSKTELTTSTIEAIKYAIVHKNSKQSYEEVKVVYGKGILLLYLDDPFAGSEEIDCIVNFHNYTNAQLPNFHSIYLYFDPLGHMTTIINPLDPVYLIFIHLKILQFGPINFWQMMFF